MESIKNNLDKFYEESKSCNDFSKNYLNYMAKKLSTLDYAPIAKFAEMLIEGRESGRNFYFIGNGGSAATSNHFANDLLVGLRLTEKPLKAISLSSNSSILTCIGNDFGYDHIFSIQLEKVFTKNDVLVAISASGNSPNIIKAVELVHSKGGKVVGLTGFDGGKLRPLSDLSIHFDCPKGEYGPVEDFHMCVDHLVSSYLIRYYREEKTKKNFISPSRDESRKNIVGEQTI